MLATDRGAYVNALWAILLLVYGAILIISSSLGMTKETFTLSIRLGWAVFFMIGGVIVLIGFGIIVNDYYESEKP